MVTSQPAEILIKNAIIFTGDRRNPFFGTGAIAIDKGRIIAVGDETSIATAHTGYETIDAGGGIAHPGFLEPHLHLLSVPFHSLSIDPDGLSAKQISYSSIKTETDDASVQAFATCTAMTCLKKGYTLITEPGTLFETDAFAEAIQAIGSRAMVSAPYGWDDVTIFYDLMPGTMSEKLMQRAPASAQRVVDRTKKELERNQDAEALVKGFVCLYGLGSSTTELIEECIAISRAHKSIYSQHNGYLPEYVDAEEKYFGETDIARLAGIGGLGPDVSLTHLNVVRPFDAKTIETTKTNVLWSPLNALHRGLHLDHECYHPQWYKSGGTVTIASDSALEYPYGSAGLAGLLLSGAVGNRLESHAPFYMHTIEAAKSLGISDELGSIEVGKRADIVLRKPKDLSETPLSRMGNLLATSSSMIEVDRVLVNGVTVLKNGQLTSEDESEILANGVAQRSRVLEKVHG